MNKQTNKFQGWDVHTNEQTDSKGGRTYERTNIFEGGRTYEQTNKQLLLRKNHRQTETQTL